MVLPHICNTPRQALSPPRFIFLWLAIAANLYQKAVEYTSQKGGRHNIVSVWNELDFVVFTPQKGGRHNAAFLTSWRKGVVFTPQKGGRHIPFVYL